MPFHYQTTFVLDRAYYTECYQESVIKPQGIKAYYKAIFLFVMGLLASSIAQEYGYLAIFVIVLAVVEALSVRFNQTWWLWRQLLSKAANNSAQLTITEEHVAIDSVHVKQTLNWQDIKDIQTTQAGFLLVLEQGRYYLSNSYLSEEAIGYLNHKIT